LLHRSANVLDKIVFWGLLALIAIAVVPYGTVDAWWEAVFECAVFALTALWIFEVLLRGTWKVRRLFILLPVILITVFAFAQTIDLPAGWLATGSGRIAQNTLSIDRYQTFLTARKALALTLFVGLLLLHTSTPRRLHWLVRVVIGIGFASAVFGILRQFLQSADSETGFVFPFLFYGSGYGQFLSPNVFAYLMEMTFALLAGLVLGGGVRRERVPIYLAIVLFVWTALVLSNSRGGIVSLACQAIFLVFVSVNWYSARRLAREDARQHKWLTFVRSSLLSRIVLVVLIVGTLVTGVLWMGGERLGLKLAARSSVSNPNPPDFGGISRTEIWRSSWEVVKHHPWTGVGFGAYFLAVPEYQVGSGLVKLEEAHNDYLDLAANGGMVAVGLAGWFIAMVILRTRSSLRSRDAYRRAAALAAAAGLLSVGVHSLVDFGLQITGISVVFAALLVIAVADNRVEAVRSSRSVEGMLPDALSTRQHSR